MIVTADLHLKAASEDTVFDEVLPGLAAATREDRDRTLAILGDVYHERNHVAVRLQNRLYQWLGSMTAEGHRVILLPGNHDQINDQGDHALLVFGEIDGVDVISTPRIDDLGVWIPYRRDPAVVLESLGLAQGRVVIAWMHHGIEGARMNQQVADTEGIRSTQLGAIEHAYLGHYHTPQDVGRATYIGSPYQTRADERGQQKRYGVFTPSTAAMEFVDVDWGPKYHRITVGSEGLGDIPAVDSRDEVQVEVTGVDPEEVGRQLREAGLENVRVTEVPEVSEARLEVGEGAGVAEYADQYAAQFGGDLDHERLMRVFREIAE